MPQKKNVNFAARVQCIRHGTIEWKDCEMLRIVAADLDEGTWPNIGLVHIGG